MRTKGEYAAAASKVAKLAKSAKDDSANSSNDDFDLIPGKCAAWGCELPGCYGESGGSRWMCAAHDGILASEWHTVTNRVRNRIGAFDACLKVITSAPIQSQWEARAQSFLERHGLSHLLQGTDPVLKFHDAEGRKVSARKFFAILHKALIAECRLDLATAGEAMTVRATSGKGLVEIGNLIG